MSDSRVPDPVTVLGASKMNRTTFLGYVWLVLAIGGCSCRPIEEVRKPPQSTEQPESSSPKASKESVGDAPAGQDQAGSKKESGGGESTSDSQSQKGSASAGQSASQQVATAIEQANQAARKGNYKAAYQSVESTWTSLKAAGASAQQLDALLSKMEEYGERFPTVNNPGDSKHWVVE